MEKKLKYDEIVMQLAEEEIEESFDLDFTEPEKKEEVKVEGGKDLEPTISE
jgi:hypothetical protein